MKRHQVLIPISREHHRLLMLAQLLKKDAPVYPSLPTSLPDKLTYASKEYENMIKTHLERDSLVLYPFLREYKFFQARVQDLERREAQLINNFEKLGTYNIVQAHKFATDLETYVRIKERELFQHMQEYLSEDDFMELSSRLEKT